MSAYFADKILVFYEVTNFIDYQTVKDDPIDKMAQINASVKIDPLKTSFGRMDYQETRVELQDNLWQYFVEP